mgnify:CR=1 FL=1
MLKSLNINEKNKTKNSKFEKVIDWDERTNFDFHIAFLKF